MLTKRRLSALGTTLAVSLSAMVVHANDGRMSLTKERMDNISAGNVVVTATADGSNIAISHANVRSGGLSSFGTGVSVSCCDNGSTSLVSTSGGSSSVFSPRNRFISVSFGVVFSRTELGSSRVRRAKY